MIGATGSVQCLGFRVDGLPYGLGLYRGRALGLRVECLILMLQLL